jgi:predicted glycosyltransferase
LLTIKQCINNMKKVSNTKPRVIIHCQYVYGIGHLVRTVELASGLSENFQVFIFNGGETVPNFYLPKEVTFIQLPAIYKKENSNLLSPVDSSTSIEECFQDRRKIIEKKTEEIKPDILITEHFPFGLLFENEVTSLISKVKFTNPSSKIISSVRDIIESNGGGKNDDYIAELINEWYDMVLVHGDENCLHLKQSFSQIDKISVPIFHTGYIVRPIPRNIKTKTQYSIILASVAGGRLGNELLESVIDSHLVIKEKIKHSLILFSGAFQNDFKQQEKKISDLNSEDIKLHCFDSKMYLNYLSQADLVISLGGYNSIIESVSAQKTMLVYQRGFSEGNEEQDLRIKVFEDLGCLKILKPQNLTIKVLPETIINCIKTNRFPKLNLNLKGVQNSSDLIMGILNTQN